MRPRRADRGPVYAGTAVKCAGADTGSRSYAACGREPRRRCRRRLPWSRVGAWEEARRAREGWRGRLPDRCRSGRRPAAKASTPPRPPPGPGGRRRDSGSATRPPARWPAWPGSPTRAARRAGSAPTISGPAPRDIRSPPLSAWSTTSLARCSAAIGILPSAQRSPTAWASGSTTSCANARRPRSASCWATSPRGARGRTRARPRPGSRATFRRASASPPVPARPRRGRGREVADALAGLDEAGEGPEQRDLVPGVGAIAVGHPLRTDHLVAPLPGAQPRSGASPVSSETSWISYVRSKRSTAMVETVVTEVEGQGGRRQRLDVSMVPASGPKVH